MSVRTSIGDRVSHGTCECRALFNGVCSWSLARRLARRHESLRRLFRVVGPLQTEVPRGYSTHEGILRAIVSQMVSSKAAAAIRTRLLEKHGSVEAVFRWAARGRTPTTPGGGLTLNKRKALRAWWKHCAEGARDPAVEWARLSSADLREAVSELYGLGPWSADVLGIFQMGRLDIWPVGDVGLERARAVVFRGMRNREFRRIIGGYESLVATYLWEVLNRDLLDAFSSRSNTPGR